MSYRNLTIFAGTAILAASAAFAETTVPVLSGGIGEDELAQIEATQNEYNLKLVYTGERGMYLSDVHVVITDAKANVLVDENTTGPFLLTKLPAGSYTVESSIGAFNKKLTVRVNDNLRTMGVNFPVKDEPANVPIYRNDALDVLSPDAQPRVGQPVAVQPFVAPTPTAPATTPVLHEQTPVQEPAIEITEPAGE